MKDETLLPDDLIHMAISAIEDLLDHCDPSTDHYCGVWADVPDKLRAAIQSGNSGQPVTVPDGYVLVPVEPTVAMTEALWDEIHESRDMNNAYRAMLAAAPTTPDGWIPVSERMPPCETGVLVATEMDGPGDWRMKWATYVPEHPDAINGWFIPGASWTPTHWQPLPDAPKGV